MINDGSNMLQLVTLFGIRHSINEVLLVVITGK